MPNESIVTAIVTIIAGIIGTATIAVLVSSRANTANVISSATSGLAQLITAATAPVTGQGVGSTGLNTSFITGIPSIPTNWIQNYS